MKDKIALSEGRERRRVAVTSKSKRLVRISSHYPFWRVNPRLDFDRDAARGFHLDIPAGTTVAWAPNETKDVNLVAYGGLGVDR